VRTERREGQRQLLEDGLFVLLVSVLEGRFCLFRDCDESFERGDGNALTPSTGVVGMRKRNELEGNGWGQLEKGFF
jgi:hypothetical protein